MRISRPPQAAQSRQKLRRDVEHALAHLGGSALCTILEGAIARFRAASIVAEVPASTFDATYAAYEAYLAQRRKGEPMWTYSGWLQHAGLSEKFPAEEVGGTSELGPIQRKCLAGPRRPAYRVVPIHDVGCDDDPCSCLDPQRVRVSNEEYEKMQGLRAEATRNLNIQIQQAAHEQGKKELVGRWDVDHHCAAEN